MAWHLLKHPRKLQAVGAFRLTDAATATTVPALFQLATQPRMMHDVSWTATAKVKSNL